MKMKKNKNSIPKQLIMALLLLLITIFCSCCCRKPESCHHKIMVVNNSDSIVSLRRLAWFMENYVALPQYKEIPPHDSFEEILAMRRDCIEELIIEESYPSENLTLFILPKGYPFIKTTIDSLEISYDILKIIDLCALGGDSLQKANYTVYYP